MKKTKKIALIIAVLMLMAVCFAFGASAVDSSKIYAEGQCGENATYTFDSATGELVISGTGAIKEKAFYKCDEIKSVIIGDGITEIGEYAFWLCDFASVDIPDSVEKICDSAFGNCDNLETIKIGKNVREIASLSFIECEKLLEFIVDEENSCYYNDEYGALYDNINNILVQYPAANPATSYEVAEGIVKIDDGAFALALNLAEIKLPSSLKVIGDYAFEYVCRIKEIAIPDSVEQIGFSAFVYCINLEKVKLPDSLTYVAPQTFTACISLKEVFIPESVTAIDFYAFYYSFALEKVIIENPNITIGASAFHNYVVSNGTLSIDEWIAKIIELFNDWLLNNKSFDEIDPVMSAICTTVSPDVPLAKVGIYCHDEGITYTAETYAEENGIYFEYFHELADEWTYDYENMIRYRECVYPDCDYREVEELEIEEITGDNFLLIEEKVTNGIEGDVEVLKAFDINLKNSDGVHVQPDGTVKVKLPNDWSKNGVYKVYRVNDDGTLTDMNAYREGSHLVFDADHFSIYVIVVEGEDTTEEEPEIPNIPAEPDTTDCDCICHATGFLNRILAFVYRVFIELLGTAKVCKCGVAHY